MPLLAALSCSILFVGNSFTYGAGSPAMQFHPETVTDLNGEVLGGVPALFKSFADQSGLHYDVSLEVSPGKTLRWHLDERLPALERGRWDIVVLQGYSTLDRQHPGDPTEHVAAARELARALRTSSPAAQVDLVATWPRADQVYPDGGHWHGQTVYAMTKDLAAAARTADQGSKDITGVAPVGSAWARAFRNGIADPNPYDGIGAGQLDLWSDDAYHASASGSYLAALVIFGHVTGVDPKRLGAGELAAAELGLSPATASRLQQVARAELAREHRRPPACQAR